MLDDTETKPVKLKRKLSYKHSVAFEKIAKCLVEHSDLFKNEGIETILGLRLQAGVYKVKKSKIIKT